MSLHIRLCLSADKPEFISDTNFVSSFTWALNPLKAAVLVIMTYHRKKCIVFLSAHWKQSRKVSNMGLVSTDSRCITFLK